MSRRSIISELESLVFDRSGDITLVLNREVQGSKSNAAESEAVETRPPKKRKCSDTDSSAPLADTDSDEIKDPESLLVSSKHLMVASPVFEAMLGANFAEGATLREKGSLELPLPEDNLKAMKIVMNIIHGHNNRVPRDIDSLDLLLEVAKLVDKYMMHEAVQLWTERWVDEQFTAWWDGDNELMDTTWSRLAIAWVFKIPGLFRDLTAIVIRNGTADCFENINQDLPIPSVVIDDLKTAKDIANPGLAQSLVNRFNLYARTRVCTQESCNIHMLGSFVQASLRLGYLRPETYQERSSKQLADYVNRIKTIPVSTQTYCPYREERVKRGTEAATLCAQNSLSSSGFDHSGEPPCNVSFTTWKNSFLETYKTVEGLNMANLK